MVMVFSEGCWQDEINNKKVKTDKIRVMIQI